MASATRPDARVSVDGKFFRLGARKFFVKGVAYGGFGPNSRGEPFPEPERMARDFALVRELGANVLRVYDIPTRAMLDLAHEHQLKLLVDVPWNTHVCFLDDPEHKARACDAVWRTVSACARHPAVFAFSVANEVPAEIV